MDEQSEDNKTVEAEVVTPTPQQFVNEYNDLCKRLGFEWAVIPKYVATNHASFETVLEMSVVKSPEVKP